MRPIWIVAAVLLLALIGFIYSQERMMGFARNIWPGVLALTAAAFTDDLTGVLVIGEPVAR